MGISDAYFPVAGLALGCDRQRPRATLSNGVTTVIAVIAAMTLSASGAARRRDTGAKTKGEAYPL
jgi:hypothetical protein